MGSAGCPVPAPALPTQTQAHGAEPPWQAALPYASLFLGTVGWGLPGSLCSLSPQDPKEPLAPGQVTVWAFPS